MFPCFLKVHINMQLANSLHIFFFFSMSGISVFTFSCKKEIGDLYVAGVDDFFLLGEE